MGTAARPIEIRPSTEEWKLRVKLAACYRIFAHLRWDELIYNHVTVRVPGPDKHFLINPFGLMYREVRASNLVKIDLDGRIVGASKWPVNPAGFTIHSAIHEAVPEAHCVMHTHTTAGMAVACSAEGLRYTNFYAAQLHGHVAYHDFEGIALYAEEKRRLVDNLGGRNILILRNHGLLAVGRDIAQAFAFLWTLQRACEVQIATMSVGEAIPISEDIRRRCTQDSFQFQSRFGAGWDMFDALTRQIDDLDPSYKT
jgi:ribulose-5-phosphate 4-epimerase/fuculose-1-phosphate aldolase